MERLSGLIRGYPWGSHEAIAQLQGRPAPTVEPEAELWLGAHPDSPSTLERGGHRVSLLEVLAEGPERVLGARALAEFGPRLPFLLKVLAAEQPLSLQAHPDAEQARRAYDAERAAGDGPYSYTDPYHKPEMLVALTEFDALCGFRDPAVSADLLARLKVPALEPVVAALADEDTGRALRTAVATLLRWPAGERADLVAAAVAGAGDDPCLEVIPITARRYPTDPGVLVAMLLNRVVLRPGEAISMPAGNLHGYLAGVGIEAMASSDNVLRGGFTGKPVDVAGLLGVLRFEVLDDPLLPPSVLAPGLVTWPVAVPDFALFRVAVAGAGAVDAGAAAGAGGVAARVEVPVAGPAVALCVVGSVVVDDGAGPVALARGQAAFARASGEPVRVTGDGTAFVLSTGL